MAPSTSNPVQEQQLSHQPATFGYGQLQQVPDGYTFAGTVNQAVSSADQGTNTIMYETGPHAKTQHAYHAPDGSSPPPIKASVKMHVTIGPATEKRKREKKSTAKKGNDMTTRPQAFALQVWSDEPSRSGPFFLLQDPSANHVDAALDPQGPARNFLEGRAPTDQFPNWSVQDQLVHGVGAWAGEGA
jgi:hypothetical protein